MKNLLSLYHYNKSCVIMSDKKSLYCVIMAGGVGSRFWPISRHNRPKQFLDVLGTGKSLLRATFERFANIIPVENIFVATNTGYREMVLEEIPEIGSSQVLCEPMGKNTARAVCFSMLLFAFFR